MDDANNARPSQPLLCSICCFRAPSHSAPLDRLVGSVQTKDKHRHFGYSLPKGSLSPSLCLWLCLCLSASLSFSQIISACLCLYQYFCLRLVFSVSLCLSPFLSI